MLRLAFMWRNSCVEIFILDIIWGLILWSIVNFKLNTRIKVIEVTSSVLGHIVA